jgi:hypothetical protein
MDQLAKLRQDYNTTKTIKTSLFLHYHYTRSSRLPPAISSVKYKSDKTRASLGGDALLTTPGIAIWLGMAVARRDLYGSTRPKISK